MRISRFISIISKLFFLALALLQLLLLLHVALDDNSSSSPDKLSSKETSNSTISSINNNVTDASLLYEEDPNEPQSKSSEWAKTPLTFKDGIEQFFDSDGNVIDQDEHDRIDEEGKYSTTTEASNDDGKDEKKEEEREDENDVDGQEDKDATAEITTTEKPKIWRHAEYPGWQSEFNQPTIPASKYPVNVLIIAPWRYGFNFISELLERHPKIFYLYHPFVFTEKMDNHEKEKSILEILIKFYDRCKIPRYSKYRDDWRDSELQREMNLDCNTNDYCYRDRGYKFRSRPICDEDFYQLGTPTDFLDAVCPLGEMKLRQLEQICEEDNARIITTDYLDSLENKLTHFKAKSNFRVIIWVRDPRAVAASKLKTLGKDNYTIKDIQHDCRHIESFVREKFKHQKSWKMQVNFLRYEDFVNDPDYTSKEMFANIGLKYEKSFSEFIFQETHDGHGSQSDIERLTLNATFMEPYSTLKEASSVPYSWLTELDWSDVLLVQKLCPRTMRTFGYTELKEEEFEEMKEFHTSRDKFTWNLNENELPLELLSGKDGRENLDENWRRKFERKYWGFGR